MQFRSLTRADEVFNPRIAEERRKDDEERKELRKQIYRDSLEVLFKQEVFRDWLTAVIEPTGYWRRGLNEESPFELGKKAAVTLIVERILESGGRGAREWFTAAAAKYIDFIQTKDKGIE